MVRDELRPREWLLDRFRARHLAHKTANEYVVFLTRLARWCIEHVGALGALLATFEAGGIPFPPTGESIISEDTEDSEHV
ncbi:MAG: hypothetical protein ACLQPH_07535 [Acidimicrobiales bacterium]